jgi:hypothetical protein
MLSSTTHDGSSRLDMQVRSFKRESSGLLKNRNEPICDLTEWNVTIGAPSFVVCRFRLEFLTQWAARLKLMNPSTNDTREMAVGPSSASSQWH